MFELQNWLCFPEIKKAIGFSWLHHPDESHVIQKQTTFESFFQ
jgi:hypothetical protein